MKQHNERKPQKKQHKTRGNKKPASESSKTKKKLYVLNKTIL